jgi:Diphthamide synthase
MKFVALVSGGKDSIYSIVSAQKYGGHELIACVHLAKPNDDDSFMYQSAASEAVRTQVEECMCVPLVSLVRTGTSLNTSLVYDNTHDEEDPGDEVEDLYRALKMAKERFPEIQAVSSGAILSTYQRYDDFLMISSGGGCLYHPFQHCCTICKNSHRACLWAFESTVFGVSVAIRAAGPSGRNGGRAGTGCRAGQDGGASRIAATHALEQKLA